jgi:hypothetical protein
MHSGRPAAPCNFAVIRIHTFWSTSMKLSKQSIISRVAIIAAAVSVCHLAMADELPRSKEIQNLIDFQCNAAKTLKQAEANYADMARGYTDSHPVIICLKKKIEELKAAGK